MPRTPFSDILQKVSFNKKNRTQYFLALPLEWRARVLQDVTHSVLLDLLERLPENDLVATFEYMDPDEAADLLQHVPARKQARIMEELSLDLTQSVSLLKEFDPKTAAGLMNLDYIQVNRDDTLAQVARKFKIHERRTGRIPVVVVLVGEKVAGYVPAYHVVAGKQKDVVSKYLRPLETIAHDTKVHDIIKLFNDHPHNKVAVLGPSGSVLGVVYSDDVLRALKGQESTLYDFAGLREEETVLDSTARKVSSRWRWLVINLATGFLAAFTVGLFGHTIEKFVLLAVYMPIVAGMGGNAATQTLAVMVRGIALKQIDIATGWKTLKREVGAGVVNGVINGVIIAAVVVLVNHRWDLAFVLASAMVVNLFVAGLFGTIVPLIMKALKKDPATSATIFITTATDVLGFLAFLGLASVVLK